MPLLPCRWLGCFAGHHPRASFDGSTTARSPRVMRTASRPRHPAQPARAEASDVRSLRSAGGFGITRSLAATRWPYLRVHFRYGSAVCSSALRTPIAGLTLLGATPPKDGRRGPDFNRLSVRTAGRTSAAVYRRFRRREFIPGARARVRAICTCKPAMNHRSRQSGDESPHFKISLLRNKPFAAHGAHHELN